MPEFETFFLDDKEKKSFLGFVGPHLEDCDISDNPVYMKSHLSCSPEKREKIIIGGNIEIFGTHLLIGSYPKGISSTFLEGNMYLIRNGAEDSCIECIKFLDERTYKRNTKLDSCIESPILLEVKGTSSSDYPVSYFGSDIVVYRIGNEPVNGSFVRKLGGKEAEKYEFTL